MSQLRDAVVAALDAHLALRAHFEHMSHTGFIPELEQWSEVLAAAIVWAGRNGLRVVERGRVEKNEIHGVEIRTQPSRGLLESSDLIAFLHVPDELVGSDVLGMEAA